MNTAAASSETPHVPVLLAEVIAALQPRDGGIYVDGTFGAGGYTSALLEAAHCQVWAIDRDPDALARGAALAERFPDRLHLIAGRFGEMADLLAAQGVRNVDGIALDIGVSSMQIDDRARGFSFLRDGPLDMRMERAGRSAADIVNTLPEKELADIIFTFGEERYARRVAKAIVAARLERPFSRTLHLADVIRAVVRRALDGIDPATRTFQGLRIYVNDELGELGRGLRCAEFLLRPGGRIAVVSFHSLEDRIVKTFLRTRSAEAARPSRHMPASAVKASVPTFTLITKRPALPSNDEIDRNPRSHSARLRAAERTSATALAAVAGGQA
ncbi:MAG: 16S rRNA (cytosine(1402)-N(4))-methyltransferase RsmH [Alphaproteobacteria bacterium]|nr:16S rRNA (cytosine(1402)-N(4))-methyltransferase RsmH [Alphaproteobacteria bacterium]PHX99683.1 MAG: 16S rRNA (cytosine(1402)-N(4))-methyltransferase [Rhodospirillaceae bacterium]